MRLIDADAYIKYCEKNWIPLNVDAVNKQPTADVVERKVGKWIISKMPVTGAIEHRCSECDTPYYMAFCLQMNYCPNCGAEMEKGEEE